MPSPRGRLRAFVRTGNLVFVSGTSPGATAKPWVGQLGRDVDTATGRGPRAVAIDLMGTAAGRGRRPGQIVRIVKVMSLVNSTPGSPSSTW